MTTGGLICLTWTAALLERVPARCFGLGCRTSHRARPAACLAPAGFHPSRLRAGAAGAARLEFRKLAAIDPLLTLELR